MRAQARCPRLSTLQRLARRQGGLGAFLLRLEAMGTLRWLLMDIITTIQDILGRLLLARILAVPGLLLFLLAL